MIGKTLADQLVETFGSEDFLSELIAAVAIWKKEGVDPQTQEVVYKLGEFAVFLDLVDKTYSQADNTVAFANQWVSESAEELNNSNEQVVFLNKAITTMFNSLDQGFIIVDSGGMVTQFASNAARNIIGRDPVNLHLAEIFEISEENMESFVEWLAMLFDEVIPFDDLIALAPKTLTTLDETQKIEVTWRPIRSNTTKKVDNLVLIFEDVTAKYEAEAVLKKQKHFTEMVIKYINGKANFVRMIQMTRETADFMKSWVFNNELEKSTLEYLSRELHTLKGGLNMLSLDELGKKIHDYEDEIKNTQARSASIEEIEKIVRYLGEDLAVILAKFLEKYKRVFKIDSGASSIREIPVNRVYKFSDRILKEGSKDLVNAFVKDIVEVPILSLFSPIESNVFSKSQELGKIIEFSVKDPKGLRIIPEFYSNFFEHMIHVFNNMVDHGIESSDGRSIAGKDQTGRISVTIDVLDSDSSQLQFIITDDGKGINPKEIRKKLDSLQIDHSNESDEQVIYHVFDQGFSTRDTVSTTSGRGIGMSAFMFALEELKGSVKMTSVVGQGTRFEITLPYVKELESSLVLKLTA